MNASVVVIFDDGYEMKRRQEWNEWCLNLKAIKMACADNMSHSIGTLHSCGRNSADNYQTIISFPLLLFLLYLTLSLSLFCLSVSHFSSDFPLPHSSAVPFSFDEVGVVMLIVLILLLSWLFFNSAPAEMAATLPIHSVSHNFFLRILSRFFAFLWEETKESWTAEDPVDPLSPKWIAHHHRENLKNPSTSAIILEKKMKYFKRKPQKGSQ